MPRLSKFKYFIPLAMLAIIFMGMTITPGHVFAAKEQVDPGYRQIFDEQLCPALKKISGEKLSGTYCTDYIYQADLTKAEQKICAKYGSNKLKTECQSYANYQKGSFTPIAGGSGSGGTDPGTYSLGPQKTGNYCGGSSDPAQDEAARIYISIPLGCQHKGPAMLDATFAIINFLSKGAGLFIIGSLVVGGIQYIISQGDPQATAAAVNRIRTVLISLLIFIFAYAFLNYLVPGQILK